MAKKTQPKERQIGKSAPAEKKYLVPPRYKNLVSTVIVMLVLLFFFIMNNTRTEPESGPYPPDYNTTPASQTNTGTADTLGTP